MTDVNGQRDKMVVTCKDGRTLEVDDVVLCTPPTTWQKISFSPEIPTSYQTQMGDNLKYLATVKSRFWGANKLSPDSQSDGFISMTWEGTDNQPGDGPAELSCFSGGPAAVQAHAIPRDQRDKTYAQTLEKLYPGFTENFISSRFMSWPDEPWTLAGYSLDRKSVV